MSDLIMLEEFWRSDTLMESILDHKKFLFSRIFSLSSIFEKLFAGLTGGDIVFEAILEKDPFILQIINVYVCIFYYPAVVCL